MPNQMKLKIIKSFTEDYDFLSNFYPIVFEYNNVLWKTSEHAYQASKFDNPNIVLSIIESTSPGKTKKIAALYKDEIRPSFHVNKLEIMEEIVRAKFSSSPLIKQKLLSTGDAELVEGNNWNDEFWGRCNGRGLNHLGEILMKVREEFKRRSTDD